MLLCCSILIFLGVFGLPLLPGLLEIVRPSDAQALMLDRKYTRTPAFFSESFRRRIAQDAQSHVQETNTRAPFLRRKAEYARWEKDLVVVPGSQENDVVVASGRVMVGDGARLRDVVSQGDLSVGDDVRARSLLSSKSLHVGARCVIDRWAHADGDLVIKNASSAGASLTAMGTLSLHGDVRFQRAFGMPIRTNGGKRSDLAHGTSRRARVIPDGSTVNEDVICTGDLSIGERCTLLGSVKTHGALFIGAGTRIDGNVVARKDVVIAPNVSIGGHVFTEYRATLGSGTSVGTKDAYKSVYAARGVVLDDGAVIWGAIVNEAGRTRRNLVAVGVMLFALMFVAMPAAHADQGSPDISITQTSAVYSPSVYGDESITTIDARVTAGQNKPGISFSSGTGDITPGTWNRQVAVDDYLQFSPTAFAYASVQAGSGALFPGRGAYAEIDGSVHSHWSAGAGAGVYTFTGGILERYVSIGPTYYFPDGNVSLRVRPLWIAGAGSDVAFDLGGQYGKPGNWVASMHLANGLDPAIIGQPPFVPEPAERAIGTGLEVRRWLFPQGGVVAGAEYDRESDRTTTQTLYTRRALTLGFFYSPSH